MQVAAAFCYPGTAHRAQRRSRGQQLPDGHCDRLQMPIKYVNRLVQMRALRAHHNRHSIENGFRPERDVTVRAGENHAAGVCGERQRATRVVEIDAVMWPQCATLR